MEFNNLRHLWLWSGPWILVKGIVFTVAAKSNLLCRFEIRPLWKNLRRSSVFRQPCLISIAGMLWGNFASNSEVGHLILGGRTKSLRWALSWNRLGWPGYLFRILADPQPRSILLPEAGNRCKVDQDGWSIKWGRGMVTLITGPSKLVYARLSGWGSWNPPMRSLDSFGDMAEYHSPYRPSIRNVSASLWFSFSALPFPLLLSGIAT